MRPRGSPKTPGSGRKAGTPNKRTTNLLQACEERGADPFGALLELLNDSDKNMRFQAAKELCQYLYPKRKAVEVSEKTDADSALGQAFEKELKELFKHGVRERYGGPTR